MAKVKLTETSWLNSRQAVFTSAAIGLLLAYAFVSRALDTGSYWQYLGAIVFAVLSVKLILRTTKK